MNLTSERLAVLGDVTRHQNTRTYEVGKRLQLSRKTVDPVLQSEWPDPTPIGPGGRGWCGIPP